MCRIFVSAGVAIFTQMLTDDFGAGRIILRRQLHIHGIFLTRTEPHACGPDQQALNTDVEGL